MIWYGKNALDFFYPVGKFFGGLSYDFLEKHSHIKTIFTITAIWMECLGFFFLNNHDIEK